MLHSNKEGNGIDHSYSVNDKDSGITMLVVDRDKWESINIGDDIIVKILKIHKHKVRIGIYAPREISVHRNEVYRKIMAERKKESETQAEEIEYV